MRGAFTQYLPRLCTPTRAAVAVALGMLALSGPAFSLRSEPAKLDEIVELETVEVIAAPLAAPQRAVPLPMPEISTALSSPPDGLGPATMPDMPVRRFPHVERLLRDDTAITRAHRTRVRYLDALRPAYPLRAREMGWQGTVVLRVNVNADGSVGEAAIRHSSGYRVLDEAALEGVRGWRFAPPTDGEFSMPAVVDVPVRFDLRELADGRAEDGQGS